ncbi:MAG: hypothetical protein OXC81_02965 [Betaproteobacteria bacterium]|nr:hypothetical protein [Betaproteobacteria bacterium]
MYTAVAIWIVFSTFSMTFEGSVGIDKLPADENGDIKEEIKSALGGWFEYKSFIVIAAFSSITVIVSSVFLGIKGMLSLLIKEGSKQGNENSTA